MNVQELYALSSNEVEFTGEEEMVTFVPAMRMGALELIDVGVSCWSSLRGVHVSYLAVPSMRDGRALTAPLSHKNRWMSLYGSPFS